MKKRGFTLIELLIALSISSFIMMGMIQGYRNVIKFLNAGRELMTVNRRVLLLFNQLDRDLTAAFIPTDYSVLNEADKKKTMPGEEKKEKDESEYETKTKEAEAGKDLKEKGSEKDSQEAKRKEKLKNYFSGQIIEDASIKDLGDKWDLVKQFTFITTEPLQVYGQRRQRMVRVGYELKPDKEKSQNGKLCYSLYRKETTDLTNVEFKEKEPEEGKEPPAGIRTHLVCDYIKGMYVKYVMPPPENKEDKVGAIQEKEKEPFIVSTWGDKKETKGIVPQYVRIYFICWDEELKHEYPFKTVIPIFSFPTIYVEKKQEQEKKEDGQEQKGSKKEEVKTEDKIEQKETPQKESKPEKPQEGLPKLEGLEELLAAAGINEK